MDTFTLLQLEYTSPNVETFIPSDFWTHKGSDNDGEHDTDNEKDHHIYRKTMQEFEGFSIVASAALE